MSGWKKGGVRGHRGRIPFAAPPPRGSPARPPPGHRRAERAGPQQQNIGTQDKAFADLVKSSSGFEKLNGGAAPTDSKGWPTSDFKIYLSNNNGFVPISAGRYNISFNGPSLTTVGANPTKTGLKITKVSYNSSTKLHRYTMDVPAGTVVLGLRFTRTSGQVKNLKVVQPGHDPLNPPVFSNKYISR